MAKKNISTFRIPKSNIIYYSKKFRFRAINTKLYKYIDYDHFLHILVET